ncbi:hypothetical protein NliqN6_1347 [Naganishia liquefaciens]|uniref:Uncharacterized protein n=1 Tax=Naganishia liquefaciens TaxID=104408 RepID=A0A8H3TQV7_9TREE|nr:hypothetical protein NliqN6_1347 [Naganishia liquefaciens]
MVFTSPHSSPRRNNNIPAISSGITQADLLNYAKRTPAPVPPAVFMETAQAESPYPGPREYGLAIGSSLSSTSAYSMVSAPSRPLAGFPPHSDNSYTFSASISPAKQPESADAVLERSPTADQVDSTPQANRYRTPRRAIASSESDDSSMTMTTPRKSRPCGIYHPSPTKNIDALPRLLANPHDGLREQVMDGSTSELITAPLTLRARDVRKLTDISFQKNPTDRPGNSLAANHRRADSAGNVALSLLSRHSNSPTFHSPISSASHAHSIPRQPYLRTLIPARHSGIYAAVNEKFSSVHDHAIPL